MKKVLVIGGSSLLGRYINNQTIGGYATYTTSYNGVPQWRQLDVTDKLSVYRLFSDFKFDVVIHCSGLGNVDFCEQVPHISDAVNYGGVKNVVDVLNELNHKSLFVHMSTNAVYDGNFPPYDEQSDLRPINKYGFSKKLAEEYVQGRYDNWLIVRPFMLFGQPHKTGRRNWLQIIRDTLLTQSQLHLISDINWQPTSARWLAETIWALIDKRVSNESFNISQGETMSLYSFAQKIATVYLCNRNLINPVSHTEFKTIAQRPLDTSYDISKIKSLVEIPTVIDEIGRIKLNG
jgi:dTDP-4-dehydrorhamnose reductase